MLDKTSFIVIMLIWTVPILIVVACMHKAISRSFDRIEATRTKRSKKMEDCLSEIGRD